MTRSQPTSHHDAGSTQMSSADSLPPLESGLHSHHPVAPAPAVIMQQASSTAHSAVHDEEDHMPLQRAPVELNARIAKLLDQLAEVRLAVLMARYIYCIADST